MGTYIPLSRDNLNNIETHLTCFTQIFDPGYTKYHISKDQTNWDDKANFQTWEAVCKFYEDVQEKKNFREDSQKTFIDFARQTNTVMTPFYRFFYEIKSREIEKAKNITFFNSWGMDALIDDNGNAFWLENNLTPSNGDLNESQKLGGTTNDAFVQFGKETIDFWMECGKDKENFQNRRLIGCWEQIEGPEAEKVAKNVYWKEKEILSKLFDLYIWVVTGMKKLPEIDLKDTKKLRYPTMITEKECWERLHELNKRVAVESMVKMADEYGPQDEGGIYM